MEKICERCGKKFETYLSWKRKYCSLYCSNHAIQKNTGRTHFKKGQRPWNKGIPCSKKIKKRISKANKGRENKWGNHTEDTKRRISATQQKLSLQEWNGFSTPFLKRLRKNKEYVEWRMKVFLRDNFTCQFCGKRGCYLEAHHMKSFAKYPELRFDINNGITLCSICHKLTRIKLKGG